MVKRVCLFVLHGPTVGCVRDDDDDDDGNSFLFNHRFRSLINDPSAGSPTETLLRLLLPLNDQVWTSFRQLEARRTRCTERVGTQGRTSKSASPKASLNHSIGSSDGRCVQRAGT